MIDLNDEEANVAMAVAFAHTAPPRVVFYAASALSAGLKHASSYLPLVVSGVEESKYC
jgi:hypothetical protein